ncbi:hypothetical protein ESOMN_v1c02440 [Williamsoniiplasma somnilux]|uniref:Lipoprotein n=1 Tax=Williamsoniiplasma somnilux TaxID=215578 RepID=A0A2K8NZI6_9MOLU|nr:lipoprotein [Williamsoniiplasma somnilux]ATZ18628.1 hypothetical protein ESOMN_v1c02440 [Williamsoniiplasma somnilux]
MKKLLSILTTLGITSTTATTIVACDKYNKTTNISTIKNELQTIISERTDRAWSFQELQIRVDENFGEGEITVEIVRKKNYDFKDIIVNDLYRFIGNGTEENEGIYNGSIELEHQWTYTVDDITLIGNLLKEILNTPTNQHTYWKKQDLQETIDQKGLDKPGGIVVEELQTVEKNNSYSFIGGQKITEWKFVGQGNPTNDFRFNGEITINHFWDDTENTTIEIKEIKEILKTTLNENLRQPWTKEELQQKVNSLGIDSPGGIIVEEINKIQSMAANGDFGSSKWKFIGQGDVTNNYLFGESIELEHFWDSRIDSTKNIFSKKEDLQKILDQDKYKHKSWTVELLEKAIEEIDVAEGISIQLVENIDTRSWTGGPKLTKWKFIGNGKIDNNYLYNGEITLEHIWNNKKDSTQSIKTIEVELNAIVNEDANKGKKLWLNDLQEAVNRKWPNEKWGIVVEDLTPLVKNRSYEESNGQQTFKFTGLGNENNTWIYTGSVEINHEWIKIKDTTQSITEVQKDLRNIVYNKEHINKSWELEELQTAIEQAKIDKIGALTVKKGTSKTNKEYIIQEWIIIGNGKIDNEYMYNGKIMIEHTFML